MLAPALWVFAAAEEAAPSGGLLMGFYSIRGKSYELFFALVEGAAAMCRAGSLAPFCRGEPWLKHQSMLPGLPRHCREGSISVRGLRGSRANRRGGKLGVI